MRRLLLYPILLALLAACGGDPDPAEPGTGADPNEIDPVGSWEFLSGSSEGTEILVVETHRITLEITRDGDTGTVGGTAGCNHYGGDVEFGAANSMRVGEIASTAMACEPPEVMEAEAAFLAALGEADTMTATPEGGLALTGANTDLAFAAIAPVDPEALTDTTWRLDSLVDGEAVSSAAGEPATLVLGADGSLSGATGCRNFTGTYVLRGDTVTATELAVDDNACPEDLAAQDTLVLSVIGDGFVPTVEGDRLQLASMGGQGLGYVAG